ncbi:MAG: aryl-sulfate sulfotransferase [Bacteroidia bacterium]|nr:aryl-sulfate sulfotransferase [Bacteroidia bacterium]
MSIAFSASAQRTVGLQSIDPSHQKGYVLFTPLNSKKTFLINECGELVNSWSSNYTAGVAQTLTPDGSLYRCGLVLPPPRFGLGSGGIIEKFDWNGNITWSLKISDSTQVFHHDITLMPNGNLLAIVWENKTTAEAIAHGRKPSIASPSVWNEKIIEIQPIGTDSFEIVWEWSAWNHVIQDYDNSKANYGVVANHPELFDINFVGNNYQDWFHINSVDFNPQLNQIILSAHSTDEIYIIDHSTNTVTASGHSGGTYGKGGDILFRWGNPQAYQRGTAGDQRLFHQHHAHWIPNGYPDSGKIVVFNNGLNRPGGNYSSVDMIDPTVSSPGVYKLLSGQPYGPVSPVELYKAEVPTDFYAMNLSGAYSLKGGGLFITSGPQGAFIETNTEGAVVWKYINPINANGAVTQGDAAGANQVFRAQWYPTDFAGFKNKNMTAGAEIEKSPISPSLCAAINIKEFGVNTDAGFYPNPTEGVLYFKGVPDMVQVQSIDGRIVANCQNAISLDLNHLKPGIYTITLNTSGKISTSKLLVQ